MKRIAFITIAVCLVALLLTSMMVSAVTWYTNRDDIIISQGTADIDYTIWYNATGTTNVSVNFTIPCGIENLSGTQTNFTVVSTSTTDLNQTFNLTVNGQGINSSTAYNHTQEDWTSLTQIIAAGVSGTDEYLTFEWNCSKITNTVGINITGTAVNLSSTWRASVLVIKEKDVVSPTVGARSATSYFVVNNSMNITSDLWFSLTNIVLNTTFPSHKITSSITNFTITTLATNGTTQQYTQYQKRGPYIYTVEESVTGRTHVVTIKLKGREALREAVGWTISPSASVYNDVFDALNYDTLTVTLNGVSKDWTEGSIIFEDITTQVAQTNNEWVFTWTVPAAAVVAADGVEGLVETIEEIFTGSTGGIPNILIIIGVIAAIIIAIVGLYTYYPMKKTTKKRSKK